MARGRKPTRLAALHFGSGRIPHRALRGAFLDVVGDRVLAAGRLRALVERHPVALGFARCIAHHFRPLPEPPDIDLPDKRETQTMRTRSIAMLLAIAALAVLPGRAAQASELSEIRDSQKQIL